VKAIRDRNLEKRKAEITDRLANDCHEGRPAPMFSASRPHYEVSQRIRATGVGGIGAIHQMVRRVKLDRRIDEAVVVLKRHLPYHESDHVLNIAYCLMAGGTKLEDLEVLRRDVSYMDLLGAERIPDPTTAGDFLRRLGEDEIGALMEVVNGTRVGIWRRQSAAFRRRATLDADGTITPTEGEKKRGMGMSYKGIWGYQPLLVSLAETGEPLYVVNRPGNAASHSGCVEWIEKGIALCAPVFKEVWLRGDTAFSLTREFDGWTGRGVRFVFGYDAAPNLVEIAEGLPNRAWRRLWRDAREPRTGRRSRRENTKEGLVVENGYRNITLRSEEVAEFSYQPTQCGRAYRMVVVRKNLTVEQGEKALFDDVRHFFYITNVNTISMREVVAEAHARCNQENVIEQLKNGVNALRVPVHDLVSNWAYMVIASLAWTFKAWFGLLLPDRADRGEVLRLEFKRFLNLVLRIPCQVVRTGRQIRVRVLAYTEGLRWLLSSLDTTASLRSP